MKAHVREMLRGAWQGTLAGVFTLAAATGVTALLVMCGVFQV